ncbi:ImmA/IrrE family metallo-endopeptidase [Gryllotalpicola reticulitermitis]|uniref:ImmA/IrrE family metallo-endopeptidase n=1 Tax=Gryllotalpicola reticulitermitis TaxID=1184153 RepID=A0ABV8QAM1_9MICO
MTSAQNKRKLTDDLVERLRDAYPVGPEPVSFPAALSVAKAQAERMTTLAGDILSPTQLLLLTPEIDIHYANDVPVPSASQFNEHTGKWQILIGSDEPREQAYDLLREFKRILDAPDVAFLYDPGSPIGDVQQQLASNYFARVALMPEKDVRRTAEHGITQLEKIATMFEVPPDVAQTRISDLGLTDRIHTD